MTVDMPVTGCIIRITSLDYNMLHHIGVAFEEEHGPAEIVQGGALLWTLIQTRMGNLSLPGWIRTFSGDLEDLETEDRLPPLGDRFVVRFELVY